MIVVADTSPLNYLVLINAVNILEDLYGSVVIPSQVLEELKRPRAPTSVSAWASNLPNWLVVQDLTGPLHPAVVTLDAGEAAATSLAIELGILNLLVDDLKARRIAQNSLGLNVIGTISVLLNADDSGLLDAEAALERLTRETTFRMPSSLREKALASLRTRRSLRTK